MKKTEVLIIRANRRTYSLKVRKDGKIEVRVPSKMKGSEIEAILMKHNRWIDNHLKQLEEKKAVREPVFSLKELKDMSEQCKKLLIPLLEEYSNRLGVTVACITIRNQKSRWGSCSSKGRLNFNCLLALTPEFVRRYVVIHELCHLRHMNHSKEFWSLVASQMPDYQLAKDWLKADGQKLIERL